MSAEYGHGAAGLTLSLAHTAEALHGSLWAREAESDLAPAELGLVQLLDGLRRGLDRLKRRDREAGRLALAATFAHLQIDSARRDRCEVRLEGGQLDRERQPAHEDQRRRLGRRALLCRARASSSATPARAHDTNAGERQRCSGLEPRAWGQKRARTFFSFGGFSFFSLL